MVINKSEPMKKIIVISIALATLLACQKEESYTDSDNSGNTVYTASTEYSSTRTTLDDNLNIRWSAKDRLTIFDGNTLNREFSVSESSDGETSASLEPVMSSSYAAGTELACNVGFYPYDKNISIEKANGGAYNLSLTLPSEQKYAPDSFGSGSFPMVAVTAGTDEKFFAFKNICGILKLQITGNETIRSITFTGNNGEILAGDATVCAKYGEIPTIEMTGEGTAIFYDCGKNGVPLTESVAKVFEIVLPPVTFTKGFTVTVVCNDGKTMNISTDKSKTIERSAILKMNPIEFESEVVADIQTGLPVVIINTPGCQDIVSKDDWLNGATITILNPDHTIDSQGTLSIKGRGNSTWYLYDNKRPYSIKLDKKSKILGMPKHKRWCLLANWIDRTMIRNAVAFEISRKTGMDWTPNGKFVELVLNGEHIGNFYLCEQIKVDENRLNLAELDPEATSGTGITGGFIFELDKNYDEQYKFKSSITGLPWMFKDPDEVNPYQFNYVTNFVSQMEAALYSTSGTSSSRYAEISKYMDLDSYADWWIIHELASNGEMMHPSSCYMHKDIDISPNVISKMKAGPVWDFDYLTFRPAVVDKYMYRGLYYPKLFEFSEFQTLIQTRWNSYKDALKNDIPVFIDNLKNELSASASINFEMWPLKDDNNNDEHLSYSAAVDQLKQAFLAKWEWMDKMIKDKNYWPK